MQQKKALFGEEIAKIPKGAHWNLQLLGLLDGKEKLEANHLICERYTKELNLRRVGYQFIEDKDDGIPLNEFRDLSKFAEMRFR